MKKLLYLLFLTALSSVSSVAQEINWVSFEKALELQKKTPKKIVLDVYTNWCGPCKMMDRYTFTNGDVVDYINKHYYAVKFNAEGNETINYKEQTFGNPNYKPTKASRRNYTHQLTSYFNVQGYPTLVFLDEKAELLTTVTGYKVPAQLTKVLNKLNAYNMDKKDNEKIPY